VKSGSDATRWWMSGGSFAAVTALCAWLGYFTTFNSFAGWDDEGYLLSTLKQFAHHGGLYTHIYSAFGPFYFEAFSTVFTWLPVTLDNGRVVTLVVGLLASLGFGVATTMFTRSVLAGVAAQVSTFILLILSFVDESMHPMVLVWLLCAAALIALALIARGHRSVGCIVLGATVAALILSVVNVGAFAAIAVLFAGLALAPPVPQMRLPRAAAAALFVCTPFLLIVLAAGHTTESWAIKYALIVTLAAGGVVASTLDIRLQGLVTGRDATRFLIGGGITGALIVVLAVACGTQPLDLVRGLFIDPARFSNVTTIPLFLPMWVEVWGACCLAGAVWYRRHRSRKAPAGLVDACAHVAAGLFIIYCALQEAQLSVLPSQLSFTNTFALALPLLFLGAIPRIGASESERIARVVVVALAMLEGLLAYPVAGAQIRWSSLLIVPVGMFCLFDGVRQFRPAIAIPHRRGLRFATDVPIWLVTLAGLAWLASVFVRDLSAEARAYHAETPLTMPGSNMIHLPTTQAQALELVSHAIHTQCSTFLTLPAMDSLYFWSGESAPPNWFNVWFYTGDASQQRQIVHRIERQDRSRFCVVENTYWLSFWKGHVVPQLPMARLVETFRRQNSPPELVDGYQIFKTHRAAP
jgi:hypothetical protein